MAAGHDPACLAGDGDREGLRRPSSDSMAVRAPPGAAPRSRSLARGWAVGVAGQENLRKNCVGISNARVRTGVRPRALAEGENSFTNVKKWV